MRLKPIGTIYSPFSDPKDMPIQPASASGITGKVVLEPEYQEGLKMASYTSSCFTTFIFAQAPTLS